jgi:hypothetical protein
LLVDVAPTVALCDIMSHEELRNPKK